MLRVYYKYYESITNVTISLPMLQVHYQCYKYITNITGTLQMLQVDSNGFKYTIDDRCKWQMLQQHYKETAKLDIYIIEHNYGQTRRKLQESFILTNGFKNSYLFDSTKLSMP